MSRSIAGGLFALCVVSLPLSAQDTTLTRLLIEHCHRVTLDGGRLAGPEAE